MRLIVAVCCLLLAIPAIAQIAPEADAFTSRSELVLVPVMVSDGSGAHLAGLKRDAFTLRDNGKQQSIAVFEEVDASTVAPGAAPGSAPADVSAVPKPVPVLRRPLLILALDRINTPVADQVYACDQLVQYATNRMEPGTLAAVVIFDPNGLQIVEPITDDHARLLAAVKRLKPRPEYETTPLFNQERLAEMTERLTASPQAGNGVNPSRVAPSFAQTLRQVPLAEDSFQQEAAVIATLTAMQQVARMFAPVPGRKALIWATAGFPFQISDPANPVVPLYASKLADVLPAYARAWQAITAANLAIYPVDVRGLTNPNLLDATASSVSAFRVNERPFETVTGDERLRRLDRERIQTMETFAEATGGRAVVHHNDLASAVARVAHDAAAYYMVGYYLPRDAQVGWHSLKVHVKGASGVRARNRFFVLPRNQRMDLERRSDVALALLSPRDFAEVPFAVRPLQISPAEAGKQRVGFEIAFQEGALLLSGTEHRRMSLTVVAAARRSLPKASPTERRNAWLNAVAFTDQTMQGELSEQNLLQVHNGGIWYHNQLELPPGAYTLRFVVRDNLSGRTGSVTLPLELK